MPHIMKQYHYVINYKAFNVSTIRYDVWVQIIVWITDMTYEWKKRILPLDWVMLRESEAYSNQQFRIEINIKIISNSSHTLTHDA